MKIFKMWNVTNVEVALEAVDRVIDPTELFDIATKAQTKEAAIAAINRIEKSYLTRIVAVHGRILKTSKKMEDKNKSAEILLYIYKHRHTETARQKIRELEGTVIKAGSHYDAMTKLNNRLLDYDYEGETECHAEDSIHSDHTDHRLTPDIRFYIGK